MSYPLDIIGQVSLDLNNLNLKRNPVSLIYQWAKLFCRHLPVRMFACSAQSRMLALGSATLNYNLRYTNRGDHSCSQRHLSFVRVDVENQKD